MGYHITIIEGNLGKDPELITFDNGGKLCKFSVAVTEKYKNKQGELVSITEWYSVEVGNAMGENCAKYLKKGSSVTVQGKMRTTEYEKDGNKQRSTKLKADKVNFNSYSKIEGDNSSSQTTQQSPEVDDSTEIDDLPF